MHVLKHPSMIVIPLYLSLKPRAPKDFPRTMALPLPSSRSVASLSTPSLPFTTTPTKSSPFTLSPRTSKRFFKRCALPSLRATLTVDSPPAAADGGSGTSKVLLEVKNLRAVIAESKQEILRGVNLTINEGEVHAIMGKNGSGKSTFSKVLVGHPDYEVTEGSAVFKGQNLLELEPEERSHAGLFMSFQTPVEIPGVSNMDFLLMAANAKRKKHGQPELSPLEFFGYLNPKLTAVNMDSKFLNRNVNEGFSGGEKKRNEILQLAVLEADLAILDEIDSGLDVDALQDVAKAVNLLLTPHNSILMITHYQRLLNYIKPNYVHIMENGTIIKTGDISLAKLLEKEGYKGISEQ